MPVSFAGWFIAEQGPARFGPGVVFVNETSDRLFLRQGESRFEEVPPAGSSSPTAGFVLDDYGRDVGFCAGSDIQPLELGVSVSGYTPSFDELVEGSFFVEDFEAVYRIEPDTCFDVEGGEEVEAVWDGEALSFHPPGPVSTNVLVIIGVLLFSPIVGFIQDRRRAKSSPPVETSVGSDVG